MIKGRSEKTLGQPCFRLSDVTSLRSNCLFEFVISQREERKIVENVMNVPFRAVLSCISL